MDGGLSAWAERRGAARLGVAALHQLQAEVSGLPPLAQVCVPCTQHFHRRFVLFHRANGACVRWAAALSATQLTRAATVSMQPTMHRISCFRDDVVFLIYLYQRHIYPEDTRRVFDEDSLTDEVTTTNPAATESKKSQ
jgi:hypothetical protein